MTAGADGSRTPLEVAIATALIHDLISEPPTRFIERTAEVVCGAKPSTSWLGPPLRVSGIASAFLVLSRRDRARGFGMVTSALCLLAVQWQGARYTPDAWNQRTTLPVAALITGALRDSGDRHVADQLIGLLLTCGNAQAGVAKLRYGTSWLNGWTLAGALAEHGTPLGKRVSCHPTACRALSLGVVAFELATLPAWLFPRTRRISLAGIVAFHLVSKVLLNIGFPHRVLLSIGLAVQQWT